MDDLFDVVWAGFLIVLFSAVVYSIVDGSLKTGPGCPLDPTYLGYCEDLEKGEYE